MREWTFLTRHATVLSLISRNPQVTALELANILHIQERRVRGIIADLYSGGYIDKKRDGRGVKYRVIPHKTLSDDVHREVAIGEFLRCLHVSTKPRRTTRTKEE